MTTANFRTGRFRRALHRFPVSSLFVLFLNANGDPSIFCYRIGVDILSAGRARLQPAVPLTAVRSNFEFMFNFARRTRDQVNGSGLYSPFSTPKE